jgi:hypothetical protein
MQLGANMIDVLAESHVSIPFNYETLTEHIPEANGQRIKKKVRALAHAEGVPAWSAEKWKSFMSVAYKCNTITPPTNVVFDPEKHFRIIFTHQSRGLPYAKDDISRGSKSGTYTQDLITCITDVFTKKNFAVPRNKHYANIRAPGVFDEKKANVILSNLSEFLTLESISTVQQMVICTCIIEREKVKATVDHLYKWVNLVKNSTPIKKATSVVGG